MSKFNGRQFQRQQRADEEIWRSKFSGYFSRAKKPVLEALRKYDPQEVIYMLGVLIPEQPIYDIYATLYPSLGYKYYKTTRREIERTQSKAFEDSTEWQRAVQLYIDSQVASRIVGVTGVTRTVTEKAIKDAVAEALEKGLSIEKTKKLIEQTVDAKWLAMRKNRARVIARTESLTALNYASLEGAKNVGVEVLKAWLPYRDSRTREDHFNMDETNFIPINDKFRVGGHLMNAPGDPNGGAAETINCRCVLIYQTP